MRIKLSKEFDNFKLIWDKTINKMCVENTLLFTIEGLEIRISSPANTAMAVYKMNCNVFDEYETTEETETINIRTSEFIKYIKACKKEVVLFTHNNKLHIQSGKKKFEMGILEDVEDKPFKNADDFEIETKCIVKVSELLESIKDTKLINQYPKMILDKDKLSIVSTETSSSANIEIIPIENNAEESITIGVNSEFIEQLANASFETITLKMKDRMPLIFECESENITYKGAIAIRAGDY